MIRNVPLRALPILVAGLLACGAPDDPGAVADAFWKAALAERFDEAASVSTAGGAAEIEALLPSEGTLEVRGEDVLRSEVHAEVPSIWIRQRNGAETEIPFHTVLVKTPHGWRVDVLATDQALRQARLAASTRDMEEAMRLGAEAVGEAFEQGAREAARAMERAAEAMQEALEGRGASDPVAPDDPPRDDP